MQEEKQHGSIWPGCSGLGPFLALWFLSVYLLPSVLLFPPFLSIPLQTLLPNSFVCQDPGYHGYQLALYEHLIPHLNIPSYLW